MQLARHWQGLSLGSRKETEHTDEHGEQAGHGSINKSVICLQRSYRNCCIRTVIFEWEKEWISVGSCLVFANICSSGTHPVFLSCCIYRIPQVGSTCSLAASCTDAVGPVDQVCSLEQEAQFCQVKYCIM